MNLFKLLGLDEASFTWIDAGACKGMDVNLFFDDYEDDKFVAAAVDERCLSCPVMRECGEFAKTHKQEGVWGGIYWYNGKIDEKRNEHKTSADWAKIKKVYK